jgi:hypothetical protein
MTKEETAMESAARDNVMTAKKFTVFEVMTGDMTATRV